MSAGDQANAREYVAKMRERGRTDEEIRRRMLHHGWREEQLAGLFGATVATPRPHRAARPRTSVPG